MKKSKAYFCMILETLIIFYLFFYDTSFISLNNFLFLIGLQALIMVIVIHIIQYKILSYLKKKHPDIEVQPFFQRKFINRDKITWHVYYVDKEDKNLQKLRRIINNFLHPCIIFSGFTLFIGGILSVLKVPD